MTVVAVRTGTPVLRGRLGKSSIAVRSGNSGAANVLGRCGTGTFSPMWSRKDSITVWCSKGSITVWSRKRTKKTFPDFIFTINSLNILYLMQQEYDTFFPVHRLYILILCTLYSTKVQSLE